MKKKKTVHRVNTPAGVLARNPLWWILLCVYQRPYQNPIIPAKHPKSDVVSHDLIFDDEMLGAVTRG